MPNEPINPGVTPTPGTPEYGRDKPRLGEGEEAEPQKPFSLDPEPGKKAVEEPNTMRPSPMDVAGDTARGKPPLAPEELNAQISKLNEKLRTLQGQLQDGKLTDKFTSDHFDAMKKVTEKMTPDMQTIAKTSGGTFTPPQAGEGKKVLGYVSNWLNAGQETLSGALSYLQTTKKPDIGSYLRLQYAVQRATQRGELFASIVGASVSGIKTIMSTQLG